MSLARSLHWRLFDRLMLQLRHSGVTEHFKFFLQRRPVLPVGRAFPLFVRQRFVESGEILRTGKNGEISVATELGCAVEHACLAAHQQCAHSVRADRRKDFEYRVRVSREPPRRK